MIIVRCLLGFVVVGGGVGTKAGVKVGKGGGRGG